MSGKCYAHLEKSLARSREDLSCSQAVQEPYIQNNSQRSGDHLRDRCGKHDPEGAEKAAEDKHAGHVEKSLPHRGEKEGLNLSSRCLKQCVVKVADGSKRSSEGDGLQESASIRYGKIFIDKESAHRGRKNPEQNGADASEDDGDDTGFPYGFAQPLIVSGSIAVADQGKNTLCQSHGCVEGNHIDLLRNAHAGDSLTAVGLYQCIGKDV